MGIEANPIIQSTQAALLNNPAMSSQAGLQQMTDFQKQQHLLAKNTTPAQNNHSASQMNPAANPFTNGQQPIHHQGNRQDRDGKQTRGSEKAQATGSKQLQQTPAVQSQAPITQQDLESSFVNLLRGNIGQLQANYKGDNNAYLASDKFTLNHLHKNYSTREYNGDERVGSLTLLERNNSKFHDTIGILGDYIYSEKPHQYPQTFYA